MICFFFTANQFCLPYWGWWCLGTHNTYINTYIHTNTKTITCKNTCRSVPMSLGGATPFFYRATYRLMFNGHKWLIRLSAISCKVSIKGKYLYKLSITVCKSQCAACQIHIWPTIYWGVKTAITCTSSQCVAWMTLLKTCLVVQSFFAIYFSGHNTD